MAIFFSKWNNRQQNVKKNEKKVQILECWLKDVYRFTKLPGRDLFLPCNPQRLFKSVPKERQSRLILMSLIFNFSSVLGKEIQKKEPISLDVPEKQNSK